MNCNDNPIDNLSINNDSIKKDGFPVEGGVIIYWNGGVGTMSVNEFDLSNISSNYVIRRGGRNFEKKYFSFKPNSSYAIKKYGGGISEFILRVWTDSLGKVFKTSHPKCGLKSLNNNEEMYKG